MCDRPCPSLALCWDYCLQIEIVTAGGRGPQRMEVLATRRRVLRKLQDAQGPPRGYRSSKRLLGRLQVELPARWAGGARDAAVVSCRLSWDGIFGNAPAGAPATLL